MDDFGTHLFDAIEQIIDGKTTPEMVATFEAHVRFMLDGLND